MPFFPFTENPLLFNSDLICARDKSYTSISKQCDAKFSPSTSAMSTVFFNLSSNFTRTHSTVYIIQLRRTIMFCSNIQSSFSHTNFQQITNIMRTPPANMVYKPYLEQSTRQNYTRPHNNIAKMSWGTGR